MFKENNAGVTLAKGFKASGIKAGVKKSGKDDMAVIYTEKPATVAGTFTTNLVAAAPVFVSKEVAKKGTAHAIVVNAGCANACTGEQGMQDAKKMAELTAQELGVEANDVFVASTGIIGQTLPMDKIAAGIKTAVKSLNENGSDAASKAIITTDTFQKACSFSFELGGKTVNIGGIAKGSGMIHPNMATMLCFITTDAAISHEVLQKALSKVVNVSFNMVSVDGDTSTNDMVLVMANGMAENPLITEENAEYQIFADALEKVCVGLAKLVARDGEGATKFLEVNVTGAESFVDAKKVAMSVAKSPLVKTAFFGEDANWGRIICAVGYAGANMVPEKTVVSLGDIIVFDKGMGAGYDEKALKSVMEEHDITVNIQLGLGEEKATVWTCDLSYEYVKINGEYHT
ncbi:bifunctional glutamate N-acetyltransferase/amino-acid acetyltransferase ArgJ [Anaerosinus massiliensis]|uniref:bifunctional glutamate N-acetyltransferase/amino-acid acetyltransferase ArgJ n=1 Tax=Massilibacillus massiliensis TaxID=1806837 RepID=UPI000A47DD54|nr:bifunctional glutamate N-acetyltransferase/amino-acid acetyltransferase ArgJ [Massilibacillus massiliensis]